MNKLAPWIRTIIDCLILFIAAKGAVQGIDEKTLIILCVYLLHSTVIILGFRMVESTDNICNQTEVDLLKQEITLLKNEFKIINENVESVLKAAAETEKLARTMNLKEALRPRQ